MSLRLFKASLRNYRRILLLSIGVILAVSLFAGINIGVDAISRGVLASYIQNVPYDMTLQQQDPNASYIQLSQQLSSLPDITHVEPVLSWNPPFDTNITSSSGKNLRGQNFDLIGVDSSFSSRYNVTTIQGNWNLTQGLILPDILATSLNVIPGGWLNITIAYYNSSAPTFRSYWSAKLSVVGVVVVSPLAQSLLVGFYNNLQATGYSPNLGSYPIIMGYDSIQSTYRSFNTKASKSTTCFGSCYNFQIQYRIFLNRDSVINLFDADATLTHLVNIENNIRIQLGFQSSVYIYDHLAEAINSYHGWLQGNLLGFYFFSLPVLPITWYLAMTSWYMVTSRRRQEFGLLKVRGVTGRQIFRTAILESIVIGIIGSILGVLAGFATGAIVAIMLGSPPSFAFTLSALTPDVLALSAFVGAFISILAAIRPARMASNLEPTEAVKEYQGEEVEIGKPWRPTWTWAAVVLGTYKMLEWILNFSPSTFFPNGPPQGGFFLAILYFIWQSLSGLLIFLGPFLFVYGVSKIVTRSQNRLYWSTALLLRSFVKDMANITARGLSRNPARSSRIAFLIALTVTFGIFVNIVTASTWDLQVRSNLLQVGADINIRTFLPGFNESFVSNLTAISGIHEVTPILASYAQVNYAGVQSVNIYGLNASNFLNVAYRTEDFTVGSPDTLFQEMQTTPNSTIVSLGLATFLGLKLGNSLQITPQAANGTTLPPVQFSVIGFFKNLPGVGLSGGSIGFGGPGISQSFYGGSIIASLSYLRANHFTSQFPNFNYLAKVNPNIDPQEVATRISQVYSQGISVETFQGRMQQVSGNAAATSIFKFLQLTSAYLLLAAVIGFALISWANTGDRMREIAIFRSRGTSRRQALQILFSESFVILLIALIIGLGTGLVSAYGVLTFFVSNLQGSTLAGLSLRLVAPIELWIMLAGSIAGFLLSILLSAWLSLRKTVVQTVRFR